jgi:alkylmercury lyase
MASDTKTIQQIGSELARGARADDNVDRVAPFFPIITRLLLRGRPLTSVEIAAAAGRPEKPVRDALDALEPVERDAEGRVVGLGLTLVPTPHHFRVEGRDLYTWCALDTLIFPSLLEITAEVVSPCHASGTPVRLTATAAGVSGVEPAAAVLSVVPIEHAANIRTAFCDHVHFFRSAADAGPWLREHPGGAVLPVAEAFALGRGFADEMR